MASGLLGLSACRRPSASGAFRNTDITGADFGRGFRLQDAEGRERTLQSFAGKVVVVFFGYTQCPDVCPTTLSQMAEVMRLMGPQADRVQVCFVTVDPERDTSALLAQYVPAFDPRFLGLRGDSEATQAVTREFRVFVEKVPGKTPSSYTIDHTAGSYVFDPQGRLRLLIRHGQEPAAIAADLSRLLAGA